MTKTSTKNDIEANPTIDQSKDQEGDENSTSRFAEAVAPLIAGLSFIVGFVLYATVLNDLVTTGEDELTLVESVEFLKENQAVYYASNLILYVLFGLAQLAMTIAISQRAAKKIAPSNDQFNSYVYSLGAIWSGLVIAAGMIGNVGADAAINLLETDPESAGLLWETANAVFRGVGGGNEIVGALWIIGVAWTWRRQCSCMYRALNVIGLIAGIAGIVSIVPSLSEAGAVFGVGMILWYILYAATLVFVGFPSD